MNVKQAIAILSFVAMMFSSCQDKMIVHEIIINACQERQLTSRTAINSDGPEVLWEPGDELAVFHQGNKAKFIAQNTTNTGVALFKGQISSLAGAQGGNSSFNFIYGLYPYSETSKCTDEYIETTLESAQTAKAGSFAPNTHITAGCSTGLDLAFYNVTGGMRFTLVNEGIKSITIESNAGEPLAGTARIAFEQGIPVVMNIADVKNSITLYAPDGGSFETGKWYYIVTLPAILTSGFKMTFSTGNETVTFNTEKAVQFSRGVFGSVSEVDKDLSFSNPEEPGKISGGLIGDWRIIKASRISGESEVDVYEFDIDDIAGYRFSSDGSGLQIEEGSFEGGWAFVDATFTWTTNDNIITTTLVSSYYGGEPESTEKLYIDSISGDNLILRIKNSSFDDVYTCKRSDFSTLTLLYDDE